MKSCVRFLQLLVLATGAMSFVVMPHSRAFVRRTGKVLFLHSKPMRPRRHTLHARLDLLPLADMDLAPEKIWEGVERMFAGELKGPHYLLNGFIGGANGVIGTMVAIDIKRRQLQEKASCPYCRGSGTLGCGVCCGTGTLTMRNIATKESITMACPTCSGKAALTCINCRGDGRGTPLFLNIKASRDPESELEDVGMG